MRERMRFSRKTGSRLTPALVAVVGLPYMSICCVVAPLGGGAGSAACCPMSDGSAQMHHSPAGDVGGSHAGQHAGSSGAGLAHTNGLHCPGEDTPVPSCCESGGKFQIPIQKAVDLGPTCGVVALAPTPYPEPIAREAAPFVRLPVLRQSQSPPLYLTNSAFLI